MKYYNLTNIINFSGISIIVILFAFLGYPEKAAELAIIIGSSILITQLFSSNSRNILILNYNYNQFLYRIKFRIFISPILFILIILFNYYYFKQIKFEILTIPLIIILQWINELNLLYLFEKKNGKKIILYFFICILFYFLTLCCLISNFYKLFFYLNIFFVIFNLFFLLKTIKMTFSGKLKKLSLAINGYFMTDISNYSFYSSSSMVLSNFMSRLLILEFLPKNFSGILFACISLGSMPGTIFNNSFGPYLIKESKKDTFKNIIWFFALLFLIFCIFITQTDIQNLSIFKKEKIGFFTYLCLTLSILGSFFMIAGQYIRQKLLFLYKSQMNKIFKIDVLNNFFYFVIVIIVIFVNNNTLFSSIFLIFSIFIFFVFLINFLFKKYEK